MSSEITNIQVSELAYSQGGRPDFAPISMASGAVSQIGVPHPYSSESSQGAAAAVFHASDAARLAGQSSQYNEIGAVLRYSDRAMGEIQARLGEMHDALDGIVKKLYPPYPLNSPERVALLNKISSLRHQIDALTYPPDEKWLARLIGDPASVPNAGDITLPNDQNSESVTIKSRPVYSGPGGLDLPDLPLQASDEAVAAGLAQVEAAQQYVTTERRSLYEETAKLFGREAESQAILGSKEVRHSLAGSSQGISVSEALRAVVSALS